MPPLRDRVAEIEPLARRFLADVARRLGASPAPVLSDGALAILRRYPWPGNIRELRNVMERAILLASGPAIEPEHLPAELRAGGSDRPPTRATPPSDPPPPAAGTGSGSLRDRLAVAEREQIVSALAACGGNQTEAARMLGMSRRNLIYKVEMYNLPRPRKG